MYNATSPAPFFVDSIKCYDIKYVISTKVSLYLTDVYITDGPFAMNISDDKNEGKLYDTKVAKKAAMRLRLVQKFNYPER